MDLGNKYLELYKELRSRWANGEVSPEEAAAFRERLSALDRQTSQTRISLVGRYWAKWTLKSEVDTGWLTEASQEHAQESM
jgi:hypothetical protein